MSGLDRGLLADKVSRIERTCGGLRNVVAHEYDKLDLRRVHLAATQGPADLRAFLRALAALA